MRLQAIAAIAALTVTVSGSLAAQSQSQASPTPKAVAPSPGEAEALATVIAIDSNEIVVADLALKKQISDRVRAYVQSQRDEHAENVKETKDVADKVRVVPEDTPAVKDLKKQGTDEVAMLAQLDGSEFEKAYLAAAVKGYSDALEMIDNKLLKLATSDAVKEHLQDTRKNVAEHLDKAKQLQTGKH